MQPKPKKLRDLPVGSRLLYRSKKDWRTAVISNIDEEKATLTVCSPTGRTYRLRRLISDEIVFQGNLPILATDHKDSWSENFTAYDLRW